MVKAIKRQIDATQLVLRSRAMRELDRVLRQVADKEVTVTLVGESGTGKEVLARRVHELSARRDGPFLPLNCAAIPESLFESELFGHERGAFTGATERVRGKVEASSGGTLFLDEIGEMPLGMQAKLLRFLENRKFMRVGGSQKISVDTRLVCATLRPIEQEVAIGRFRADLYYRIQGVVLTVPALRDRAADVKPLIETFLSELTRQHAVLPPRLTRAALSALQSYSWPGNVRELRNTVELLCLLRGGRAVRLSDLPPSQQRLQPMGGQPSNAPRAARNRLEIDLDRSLDEIIEAVLQAALALEDGSRTRAARRLGISVRTVQRHSARSGLATPQRTSSERS